MHQGHPTTNVSKYARNVSDGFLYALEACLVHLDCPKNVLSVRMSLISLGGFFVSSESVSYPYGSGGKFGDMN